MELKDYNQDWFNLNNYETTKNYTNIEWLQAIKNRRELYSKCLFINNDLKKHTFIQKPTVESSQSLKQNYPYLPTSTSLLDELFQLSKNNTVLHTEEHLPVSKLIFLDIVLLLLDIQNDTDTSYNPIKETLKNKRPDFMDFFIKNDTFQQEIDYVMRTNRLYLSIDLTKKFSEISHSLKKLIEKEQKKTLTFKRSNKLYLSRILPCMDILIWQELTFQTLTQIQIFDYIFPIDDNHDYEFENFVKSTLPYSKEVLFNKNTIATVPSI
jgi:hypothetical protein